MILFEGHIKLLITTQIKCLYTKDQANLLENQPVKLWSIHLQNNKDLGQETNTNCSDNLKSQQAQTE